MGREIVVYMSKLLAYGRRNAAHCRERIATPACGLVRNDTVFVTQSVDFRRGKQDFFCHCEPVLTLAHPRVASLALRAIHLLAIRSPASARMPMPAGHSGCTAKQSFTVPLRLPFWPERPGRGFLPRCPGSGACLRPIPLLPRTPVRTDPGHSAALPRHLPE